MSRPRRTEFTENLEAVARGVRRLEEIRDPILREAVAAALRLRARELRLDPASRARMRNTVLAGLEPARPTIADRLYGLFAILGKPAPLLVRGLAVAAIGVGLIGGATVASADSLPDDLLYGVKIAGEQLRLAVAVSPEDRATVELSIAEHRLAEAERLASAGRADDAIVATAAYGSSLADAAADLATIETTDPRTAALVTQMQTTLAASQQRVGETAARLAADPRTAATAEVLATVGTAAAATKDSPATRIADQAAAITAKLARVAVDRANSAEPAHADAPRATGAARTDTPHASAPEAASTAAAAATAPRPGTAAPAAAPTTTVTPTTRPTATATPEPTDSPDPTATARPARTAEATAHPVAVPPANPSTARQSAEKAREAAERALEAALKAKRAADRTASPSPARR